MVGKITKTHFENAQPILRVANMAVSLRYYTDVLGFISAEWGTEDFTLLRRDQAFIYLCQVFQGNPGSWVWVGVKDAAALYREYLAAGARVRRAPRNYPWALEFHVEDPDGHVLRCGSEPLHDRAFDPWIE